MDNYSELINGLFDKNDKGAYKCLKEIISVSEKEAGVYQFFDVQENLGHHDAGFTKNQYMHVTEQMKKESAARMENFINGVTKTG